MTSTFDNMYSPISKNYLHKLILRSVHTTSYQNLHRNRKGTPFITTHKTHKSSGAKFSRPPSSPPTIRESI